MQEGERTLVERVSRKEIDKSKRMGLHSHQKRGDAGTLKTFNFFPLVEKRREGGGVARGLKGSGLRWVL